MTAKRILLLEQNPESAAYLIGRIKEVRNFEISWARTMREACEYLTLRPHDIALVPITRNDSLVYSMRMLQPDLPIFLLSDSRKEETRVPPRQADAVWGIIERQMLHQQLGNLMADDSPHQQVTAQGKKKVPGTAPLDPTHAPVEEPVITPIQPEPAPQIEALPAIDATTSWMADLETEAVQEFDRADILPAPAITPLRTPPPTETSRGVQTEFDQERLAKAVRRLLASTELEFVILTRDEDVLAYHHPTDQARIDRAVEQVRTTWDEQPRTAQLQFLTHKQTRDEPMLLYTCPFVKGYLLTLGASPDTTLGRLQEQASKILASALPSKAAKYLKPAGQQLIGVESPSASQPQAEPRQPALPEVKIDPYNRYTLIWQANRPLTSEWRIHLRRVILPRVMKQYGCTIEIITINAQNVYLVTNCPPGKDGEWLIDLLKSHSARQLQAEFDAPLDLWRPFHYTAKAEMPLEDAEVNLFLQQEVDNELL